MNVQSTDTTERGTGGKAIWVFTPSRTDPGDLEFIFVQRQDLLQDAVERVRESALTDNKHHFLFAGPRGCGKTHFITLIVRRLSEYDMLTEKTPERQRAIDDFMAAIGLPEAPVKRVVDVNLALSEIGKGSILLPS